jgi:AraC-like DNA-binding protein
METKTELLFILSAVGTLNGLLLGFYLLFFRKEKTIAQVFLALLLLMLSLRIGKSVFLYFNPDLLKVYLQIGLSACFLIGPSLYYYLKASFEPVQQIPRSWKLVYGAMVAIMLTGGILYPYAQYPELWNQYIIKQIIYGSWLLFTGLSVYVYWENVYKNKIKADGYVNIVLLGNIIIFLAYLLALANWVKGSYIAGSILYSFILYLTIFTVFAKNKRFGPASNTLSLPVAETEQDKYQHKKITEQQAQPLIDKLTRIVNEGELYKNPDLKLNDLAGKMNMPGHQLSQLLNDNLGKSFSVFINEYRIREACKKIIHEPHIKIEEIGYDVGFNSKSTFFTAFKKITNTTPVLYRETVTQDQNTSLSTDL